MAAEEELSAVERTAKNNQVDTVEASDALNSRSPHFHPNFDLHQTDQKFYQFLEQQYGKEKADNPEFRAIIGNMLAQQAGGALSALKQMQTTPNPNSTESMIHAELRGGSPQLEAHLNQILAMKGITTRTDLSDPDLSLSLRQKYELLGMNPDGEDELRNYMGFLGLDKTENSLDQMRELKIQSTKIADKVIDASEPTPDNKKNRL